MSDPTRPEPTRSELIAAALDALRITPDDAAALADEIIAKRRGKLARFRPASSTPRGRGEKPAPHSRRPGSVARL